MNDQWKLEIKQSRLDSIWKFMFEKYFVRNLSWSYSNTHTNNYWNFKQTSTRSTKIKKWFTEECKEDIKVRKNNKSPTQLNLNNFRMHRAKACRTINQCKRKSWKDSVSSIISHNQINKVWNTIRKNWRKGLWWKNPHLKFGNHTLTYKKDISNAIGHVIF